jgi:penicillin V acylase-like amidase (Ntn superfamily)
MTPQTYTTPRISTKISSRGGKQLLPGKRANPSRFVRPNRAMATKSSAPQITAHTAITTTLISG